MYNNHEEAADAMQRIVGSYNERRPHQSLDYLTPDQAHNMDGEIAKRWKKYRRKNPGEDNAEAAA